MGIQKRNSVIDILKGLGIILMVACHSGFPFTNFIYLFHMAIFFIASGFCYKSTNSDSINNCIAFIRRRFLALWLPYIICTSIFTLLNNIFITLNIYTNNPLILNYISIGGKLSEVLTYKEILKNIIKSFLLSGGTQMGGALWFICVLMKISILYILFDFTIKILKWNILITQGVISLVCLLVGYFLHLQGIKILSLDKVFSYYWLYYFGFVIKTLNISDYFHKTNERIVIVFASFLCLLFCNRFGKIQLDVTNYMNPLYFFIVSFTGWIFIYELSYFISKIEKVSELFILVGKNTLSIVILHFLCFKLVSYIAIIMTKSPKFLLACFPTFMKNGVWWLAYTIIGVSLPVLVNLSLKNLIKIINSKCLHNNQKYIV